MDKKMFSDILNYLDQKPDPNQVFIFLLGGTTCGMPRGGIMQLGRPLAGSRLS